MKIRNKIGVAMLATALSLSLAGLVNAVTPLTVSLGTADSFAILAGSGITNTGASSVTGDVGSFPTTTQTGFSGANTVTITGTNHFGDATTQSAKTALATAYTDAATRAPITTTYPAIHDLGGETLAPGIYNDPSSFGVTGTLTLDGGGDPNAVFIFQAGSTLITASNSHISLINSAQACNVFWQVGSSATLGTNSDFYGTILANDSITDDNGSTVRGRLLAKNALVTLNGTTVLKPTCLAAPTLTVTKTVTNDNGGTKVIADFPLFIDGGSVTSGVANTATAGLHTVSETADVGYTATIGGDCAANGTITLAPGDVKTCTINNNDKAAHLIVIKQVINDNGGSAAASAFATTITGVTTATPTAAGVVTPGVDNILTSVGAYSIDEGAHVGYSKTLSANCSGTIALGETKTCTITNDDIAPQLTVTKVVVNNNTGTKVIANFPLFIDGGSVTSGVANTATAGLHTVSETADVGYTATIGGDCAANGTITLAPGDVKTCTITNDDVPTATINVVKVVINDNGGSKVIADFPLFVNGGLVVSGVTNTFPAPASYDVTETSDPNYTETFSGDCAVNGHIDLIPGDAKFCIITNNDNYIPSSGGGGGSGVSPVPPLIDVVKVPSPLALPAGPGTVIYTYTLRNIGIVPVTNVTMVGDTCAPIMLISGDANHNSKLDITETWIHTCSTILSKTHTNTVTATGWANGMSAVDIASATVVVSVPGLSNTAITPPLIHVTKIPSPLALPAGGGMVTYSNRVTNPGATPLSNIRLNDDKCGSAKYLTGDVNHDSKLDPSENWIYTCQQNLTSTTTNTIMASGDANGMTARDFAITTVVVAPAVPKLPNSGLPPVADDSSWNKIAATSILLLIVSISLAVFLRKGTTV